MPVTTSMRTCTTLLIVLMACRSPGAEPTSSPAPRIARQEPCTERSKVRLTIDGRRVCADRAVVLVFGHGVGDDGRVDIGKDLLVDRGDRGGRLDTYPDDRPMGLAVALMMGGAVAYSLHFGIGGLRKNEWVTPVSKQVARSYTFAGQPDRVGAYIVMTKQRLDADGSFIEELGPYRSKSGTVTFTTVDIEREHYAGHVDVVLEREGKLAHDAGDVIQVRADFSTRDE
jgi:hypothetical protein